MKITIESTRKIIEVNGAPARIWEGKTESGIEVQCFVTRIGVPRNCFITRIAVPKSEYWPQLEKELVEHKAPSAAVDCIPIQMIL